MKNALKPYAMVAIACLLGFLVVSAIPGCQPANKETAEKDAAQKDKDGAENKAPNKSDKDDANNKVPAPPIDESDAANNTPTDEAQPTDSVNNPRDDSPTDAPVGTTPAAVPAVKANPEPMNDPEPAKEPAVETDEPGTAADNAQPQDNLAAVDKNANAKIVPGDWSQWGGNSFRNNTPIGENIPTTWDVGNLNRKTDQWEDSVNIKWVARLGSQTYGNAVVADGRVYVGTNNSGGYLKRYPSEVDLGCLLCFSEKDGSLLWQHSSEKLPTGRVHDWEMQGICCAPLVEGKRLWFVSSRGKVICLDTEGYRDGEDDGPVQNELARLFNVESPSDPDAQDQLGPALAALKGGQVNDYIRTEFARVDLPLPADVMLKSDEGGRSWSFTAKIGDSDRQITMRMEGPKLAVYVVTTPDDKQEADTIWEFDMMKDLGTSQHNMCSCSVTSYGDILFVNTSNGVDESHENIPAPNAPSFVAMNKNTGEVYWTDKSPGTNILHGQWSSPTVAELGGVPQVLFAGGDGYLYSFRADEGQSGKPEFLWKFDCNPKESFWELRGRATRNNIIATPVVCDGLVYVAVGQDPEHGEGEGHLWCINPNKRGDVSSELAMKKEGDKLVPIPHKRIQAVIAEAGEVAVPNPNSAMVWHYGKFDQDGDGKFSFEETMHRSCGTVAIKDDILYISDFSGLVHCLDAKTGRVHFTYDMFAQAWGSPLIVDGKVYIGDEDGDVCVFKLDPEEIEPMEELSMGNSVYSTPIVANGVLYISNKSHLFAIQEDAEADEAPASDE